MSHLKISKVAFGGETRWDRTRLDRTGLDRTRLNSLYSNWQHRNKTKHTRNGFFVILAFVPLCSMVLDGTKFWRNSPIGLG